jgi:hypothetical protein
MSEFDDFLQTVMNMDFVQMHHMVQREGQAAQNRLIHATKRHPAPLGLRGYEEALRGMSFWLYSGRRPDGMAASDFEKLRPICQRLIDKGQLKPTALAVFSDGR